MYKIVLVKDEKDIGKAGDVLETVMYDDSYSIRQYIASNYLAEGIIVKPVKVEL